MTILANFMYTLLYSFCGEYIYPATTVSLQNFLKLLKTLGVIVIVVYAKRQSKLITAFSMYI